MFVVGLTGGIGSGKTTVANLFADLGVPLIDADIAARKVVVPGSPGLREIADHFGAELLQQDGTLDRSALRAIVFEDETERHALERILHPLINQLLRTQLQALATPYAILVSPLLLETSQKTLVDRILVVDCPESLQIHRTSQRDDCPPQQVRAIMAAQMNRDQRLQAADDVVDNDGDIAALTDAVGALHRKYLDLAAGPGA